MGGLLRDKGIVYILNVVLSHFRCAGYGLCKLLAICHKVAYKLWFIFLSVYHCVGFLFVRWWNSA